jgi:hypothetical protein
MTAQNSGAPGKVLARWILAARQAGVRVIACIACARNLGVIEALQKQGSEAFPTGQFLSDWLKSGDKMLSV